MPKRDPADNKTGGGCPHRAFRRAGNRLVRDLLLIYREVARIEGVDKAQAMGCTLDAIEQVSGLPTQRLALALPMVTPADADITEERSAEIQDFFRRYAHCNARVCAESRRAEGKINNPWLANVICYLRAHPAIRVRGDQIVHTLMPLMPANSMSPRRMAIRVGMAMKRLGWQRRRASDGDRGYYYDRPEGWDLDQWVKLL